jgi:type II secretion system protein L
MTQAMLFLRLKEALPAPGLLADYLLLDAQGSVQDHSATPVTLAQAATHVSAALAQRVPLVILLPARRVFAASRLLPEKQAADLLRQPAFLLEESLAEPLDQVTVAAGAPQPQGDGQVRVPLAAANRQWLESVNQQLAAHGFNAAYMLSEASLLPQPGAVRFAEDDGHYLIAGEDFATACEAPQLAGLLAQACAQPVRPARLAFFGQHLPPEAERIAREHGLTIQHHQMPGGLLVWLASRAAQQPAALPYHFATGAQAGQAAGASSRALRVAAWVAALALVAQLCWNIGFGLLLKQREAALLASVQTAYAAQFPQAATPTREALLAQLGQPSQASLSAALARLAQALSAGGTTPYVTELQYDAATGQLAMGLLEADFATFERHRAALAQAGFEARVDALVRESDRAKGRIYVTLP